MWNVEKGHDYIRTIDQKNVRAAQQAMVRHYDQLMRIKAAPKNGYHANQRFEQTRLRQEKRPTRLEREKALEIQQSNRKLATALNSIRETMGRYAAVTELQPADHRGAAEAARGGLQDEDGDAAAEREHGTRG
jgi:hypothetical protein